MFSKKHWHVLVGSSGTFFAFIFQLLERSQLFISIVLIDIN